jgi:hypothetical protein
LYSASASRPGGSDLNASRSALSVCADTVPGGGVSVRVV